MSEQPSRLSRFFERVGLAVCALVLFFVLAEVVARAVDRFVHGVPFFAAGTLTELYVDHPYLGSIPRPGARFGVYEVNSLGFRGREVALPKPAGVFRILTLGGSSTWDQTVSGTDATWAAQLEDRLNATRAPDDPRFEVVNGGVPGYNSAEDVMNFLWRGVYVEPDAVIVYQGYNDYIPNRWPGFRPDYAHFRHRTRTLSALLAERSRFLHWFRQALLQAGGPRGEVYDEVTAPGIAAYQENLRRIAVLARARGIQPLLSTFAVAVTEENLRTDPDKLAQVPRNMEVLSFRGVMDAHEKYNQAVRAVATELGVPLADIDAGVPPTFEFFADHCHFTDAGSRRAAAVFADAVRAHLDVRRTAPPAATAR